MAIYDEKKMKQKEVYPTEQTPSYADWALFEMGKQLEAEGTGPEIPEPELSDAGKVVKVNDQGEYALAEDDVGTRLMAGSGVEIVNDTINNTAPVPAYDTSDDGKILGVTVDSSGDTPVAEVEWITKPSDLPTISSGDAGKILAVNAGETGSEWINKPVPGFPLDAGYVNVSSSNARIDLSVNQDYDYFVWFEPIYYNNDDKGYSFSIKETVDTISSSTYRINIINRKNIPSQAGHIGNIRWFTRPKVFNSGRIYVSGFNYISTKYILPDYTSATAGQVLAVNSGATDVEWVTPASGGGSGFEYYGTARLIDTSNTKPANQTFQVSIKDDNNVNYVFDLSTYDYICVFGQSSDNEYQCVSVANAYYEGNSSINVSVRCINYSNSPISANTIFGEILVYRKEKEGNNGRAVVIGTTQPYVPDNCMIPTLGSAGQVLTVNNGGTGIEWKTPSGGGSGGSGVTLVNVTSKTDLQTGDRFTGYIEVSGTKYCVIGCEVTIYGNYAGIDMQYGGTIYQVDAQSPVSIGNLISVSGAAITTINGYCLR